jgi:cytochrome c
MRRIIPVLIAVAAIPAALQGASTATGAYTEAQAEEGRAIYEAQCAICHGAMLEGTYEIPALKGRFVAHWAGRPVATLADYISVAMPQMAPGTLSPEDSAALTAYLLKENGMPAGTRALPADMAAQSAILFTPAGAAR